MKIKQNNGIWWTLAGAGLLFAANSLLRARRSYNFKNKVVIITGGSRGLGLVMARSLADQGAKLSICARSEDQLARAKAELEEKGAGEVIDIVCDVTKKDQVVEMVRQTRAHYGRIDVLINNAGVIQVGPLEVQTTDDFEQAMKSHFWGPLYTMLEVIPEMRDRRDGRIINISSIGGKVSVPHLAPYSASKFALAGLSSAMRSELANDNVYVTTVYPGLMRTGSHINAIFKGQNQAEFAWFSISNGSPFSSISAERAAHQILEACKRGDAELIITPQAKAAVKMQTLFPETTADILSLANRLLPSPGGIGTNHALGKESVSSLAPSILTTLVDKASERNNELSDNDIFLEAVQRR